MTVGELLELLELVDRDKTVVVQVGHEACTLAAEPESYEDAIVFQGCDP